LIRPAWSSLASRSSVGTPAPLNPLIQAVRTDAKPLADIFDRKTTLRNLLDLLNPDLLGKPLTFARHTLLVA
jgi:hypothetical protein